ncbi:peptidoglycan DD-metalloendopeptidase family protein [Streptomyces sp. NPDC002619]|uniref:peptidoglycan DD-metalloendopeptidase family protein n=1 Tax=Streptomyces sp. NPDC002619 TaxID=3364655 RepID=UPI0036835FC2
MNDRHPSGFMTTPAPASDAASAHYASYGAQEAQYGDFTTYGGYDANGFHTGAQATTAFDTDPLFGNLPGEAHTTGAYDTTHWSTSGHQTPNHDPYAAQQHAVYDSGAYDSTAWTVPAQATPVDTSGQWDAGAWLQPGQQPADPAQQWDWGTQTYETGTYDATQWNSDGAHIAVPAADPYEPQAESFEHPTYDDATPYEDATAYGDPATYEAPSAYEDQASYADPAYAEDGYEDYEETGYEEPSPDDGELTSTGEMPAVPDLLDDEEEVTPVSRAGSRAGGRSRRRTPAKRSALLTVAVPSACVMGVAGIAAASVGNMSGESQGTSTTASDVHAVKPSAANNKLDTQLESLSAGADDFADRASRTQERIDLKAEQAAEKKRAAEEAARKERLRPKFALPVMQRGLSAYFGQAGVNWMSVHTGIDFPVSYGTTVMSATDGTVRTQWNSAYGNMMIVTAMDGTETWYCHLSSYRVVSGTVVKAGDPIAYSGNSGNSTGPHLHFEVRPAGGSAIDPLPWLRSHGLDPT